MRRIPLLAGLLVLALAPAAHAGWFPAAPLDGPADIETVAVDLGREETGAVAYIKRDAGGARIWLSVMRAGAWSTPGAVSDPGASDVAVAAGDAGRVAAVWIQDGIAVGALAGNAPVALSGGGGGAAPSIDIGVTGVAYAVWTQNGDVRAARLEGSTWTTVPAPLDIDPARAAGNGAGRPRVAVAADGSALVTWGEALPDGRTHVFVRRVYGTALSAIPQDATPDLVEGLPGGSADSPEVDMEYDRSYAWVVFRQDVGGRSRSIARRLRASTFEAPIAIDAGVTSTAPHIAMSGVGGKGQVVAAAGDTIVGAELQDDVLEPIGRIDTVGAASSPVVAYSDREDAAVAWHAAGTVRARLAPIDAAFGEEAVLSLPELGPAGVPVGASNRVGDVVVAMLQGAPGARVVAIAMHDVLPRRPVLTGIRSYGPARPLVKWNAGQEFMGPQTFRVLIDGREVGTTARTSLRAPRRLTNGLHRFQVIGTDRRGQVSPPSRTRSMRVDAGVPSLRVRTARERRCVTVFARTRDPRGGTGMRGVRVRWGDGRSSRGTSTRHCYRRRGRYELTVVARDRAGNKARRTVRLRV
jgi:PKD domain